jgi:hypothetical protein
MNKIKFDNTEFEVLSYSKTTYFNSESINSNGSCSILTDNIGTVNELAENPIDTIQIYHDNELVYDLQDANAKIDSINEYFTGERMNISINFSFPQVTEPEEEPEEEPVEP